MQHAKLKIGSSIIVVDGQPINMGVAPIVIAGRTMIPVRAFEEALGHTVTWDPDEQVILISMAQPSPPVEDPVPNWRQVPDPDIKPWRPWNAPITSTTEDRSAARLEAVIKQCGVASAPRYRRNQSGVGETYCNIFLWDVTKALGCEIPHWVKRSDYITPSDPDYTYKDACETDANMVCDWLEHTAFGWRPSDVGKALAYANAGKPAIAVWKNQGGIGHVAVICPGAADSSRGIPTAQAGVSNFDDGYLADGFGRYSSQVVYYVHE